jgi:polyhydroxyalkanoate synthesis repressor PhaR
VREDRETQTEPVIIKKYANRRLYNTDTSTYVTLDDLAEMVRLERDFVVYDAKTGEDLTHSVLTQIIVDQESKGQNLLPIRFLRQLIRFYGDSIEKLVPSYLELSLDTLTNQQDKYRKQFAEAFGATTAIEAMQEHTRQNLAMFEKALTMFSPFSQLDEAEEGETEATKTQPAKKSGKKKDEGEDEIAALKAQLSDMQEKLEKLSK